jgi:flagellin-like hook-associated protein FlgL
MASFGKKILSAFLEVDGEKKDASLTNVDVEPKTSHSAPASGSGSGGGAGGSSSGGAQASGDQRFSEYFDNLFSEANIPGPDYYEFARMTSAMQMIPDERSRYAAAFAGLQAQGLDKAKLVSTAGEYLRVLTSDADRFNSTVEAALQEKVHSRAAEAEEKSKRIQALSQEILELQSQIGAMQNEMQEAKSKLEAGSNAYAAESERRKQQIQTDIEKINNYIH